jgi:hypothetical protein
MLDVTGIWTAGEASNFTAFVSKLTINETLKKKVWFTIYNDRKHWR